jgi:4-amino-4-deoxy-L-arabinose transferase-like glycosyltransferase
MSQTKRRVRGRPPHDWRWLLVASFAVVAGICAWQVPVGFTLPVGTFGDRLFVQSSEALGAAADGTWYSDELTPDAPSGRSRWTRERALVTIPGLPVAPATLTLRLAGWPDDARVAAVLQPEVVVRAAGQEIGRLTPRASWQTYELTVPPLAQPPAGLTIELASSAVFTDTLRYRDPRPKGVRVDAISITPGPTGPLVLPPLLPLALLTLLALVWHRAARRVLSDGAGFVATLVALALLGFVLAFVRVWTVAALPWLLLAGAVLWLWGARQDLVRFATRLGAAYARGTVLAIALAGATLLAVASAALFDARAHQAAAMLARTYPLPLAGAALAVVLALALRQHGLPRLATWLMAAAGRPGVAALIIAGFIGIWFGWLAAISASLPYVGHADYADIAVVARNLLAGRGFVVDYVTQFYRLYDGVTRPQETWPLLQPIWLVPWFAALGPTAFAARIPNLILLVILVIGIYLLGARWWNRHVGWLAAVIVATSQLFFLLTIYVTSDLAFVVFSVAAIAVLHHIGDDQHPDRRLVLLAGVVTGLMLLQKPGSGGMMALGMGLWLLWRRRPQRGERPAWRDILLRLRPVVWWSLAALLVLMPYLVRNQLVFGRPFYSTESKDAWVLEYTGWDQIYAVYAPELSAQGVPDHTWILRWGFDRTLHKLERQVLALRDYLVPTLGRVAPDQAAWLGGRPDRARLLFEVGAWAALLGLVLRGTRRRRGLRSLLLCSYAPLTLFLVVYWHTNEERYWVALVPWLALFAAAALWWLARRIAAAGAWAAPLALACVVGGAAAIIAPSWPVIDGKLRVEPALYAPDLALYRWLHDNTPDDAVMMTRSPWQLNWHAERPAVMIPYTTDRTVLLRLARHYRARYLVLDSLQRPEPDVQRMLDALVADPALGFREAYRSPVYQIDRGGRTITTVVHVYAFPDDYGGVAPLAPAGASRRCPAEVGLRCAS